VLSVAGLLAIKLRFLAGRRFILEVKTDTFPPAQPCLFDNSDRTVNVSMTSTSMYTTGMRTGSMYRAGLPTYSVQGGI